MATLLDLNGPVVDLPPPGEPRDAFVPASSLDAMATRSPIGVDARSGRSQDGPTCAGVPSADIHGILRLSTKMRPSIACLYARTFAHSEPLTFFIIFAASLKKPLTW